MDNNSLQINRKLLSSRFPSFNRPAVVGYFSLDSERSYHEDLSQLKYVQLPHNLAKDGESCRVKYDLDKGREIAIKKEERNEKLDNLLSWILNNAKKQENPIPDVVCYRGLLTLIMCTPYENQEGWIICATKFKGILYLCQFETEDSIRKREQETARQKQMSSWGYKFEQYVCSDKPGKPPDPSPPVNEREELCVVFMTKLNGRRLLFGAEIDGILNQSGVKSCSDLAEATFVELKTSRQIEFSRQHQNFKRFKLLKWWSQSFLVGIERLICGFRDDRGVVHVLENFCVSQIHKKADNMWDPNVCMNFCDQFLKFASEIVKEEVPTTVWKFEWRPNECVKTVKIVGPSEFSFLPPWFTEKLNICKKQINKLRT